MFNKSAIMTRAHEIRKGGCNLSEALQRAWTEAKISIIEDRKFYLNMKDRWSPEDYTANAKMDSEIRTLRAKIDPPKQPDPAVIERNRKMQEAWEEKEDIIFELGCIVRSTNPDWELHRKLRTRLKEIA